MKLNVKSIALIVGLAVVVIGSVFAVSAAPAGSDGLASDPASHLGADCGDLRLDEFYACEYGGWQPTPAVEGETATIGTRCDDLSLDEYYACRASGWRPTDEAPVLAK